MSKGKNMDMFKVIRCSMLGLAIAVLAACNSGAGTSGKAQGADNAEAQGLIVSGKELYALQLYSEAMVKFDQVISSWPTGAQADDAHYYKGKSLYRLGDLDGAMVEFQTVVSQFPGSGFVDNAALWTGNVEHARANYAAARLQYQHVLDTWPTRDAADEAAYELAKTYYDEASYPQALVRLQAFVNDWPASIKVDDAAYFIARSYHRNAQFDQARLAYEAVVNDHPLSTWVDNAQHQIAKTWYDQGQYQQAIDYFTQLLAASPTAGTADASAYYLARSYHARANVNLDAGLTVQADADFQSALNAYDQLTSVAYPGSIYLDNAAYQKAVVYVDQQQDALALTQLNLVLTRYPGDTMSDDAVLLSGVIYRGQGLFADARVCFGVLLTDSGLCNGISFSGAGFTASNLRDNAQYLTGKTWYDESVFDSARTELGKVGAVYPGSSLEDDAIYYIGRSWQMQTPADYVAAETEYLKLLDPAWSTSPLLDNVNYRLGQIGHDTQNCTKETRYFTVVVTDYPGSPYAADAQLHLDELALGQNHICL